MKLIMSSKFSDILECLRENKFFLGGCFVLAGSTAWLGYKYRNSWRKPSGKEKKTRVCGVDYPKDKVMVHCPNSEGRFVPSDSPYVLKLTTFLRVAKIPHEVCFTQDFEDAPKGKIPWIEYNGLTMGDSQLIITYLNPTFGVDLNRTLTSYQRATAWAVQKWLEEHTAWLNSRIRWVIFLDDYLDGTYLSPFFSQAPVKEFTRDLMTRQTHAQGVGRHSNEEVFEMMEFDLKQLSTLLGHNRYLVGNMLTEVDCTAFGLLCQIRYSTPDKCPGKQLLNNSKDLKNLRDYIDRIRFQYWPDWDATLYTD